MSLTTITIGGVDYVSYATLAEANARLAVDPVRSAAWSALTDDQKGINLVAGTNRLDLLDWEGEKAGGATQENAWPRTGVTYKDGTAVPDDEVSHGVEVATILLAGTISLTPATSGAGSSGSNIEEVQAGSARVKFFRPTAGKPLQDETAFALVRCFLSSFTAGSGLFGAASGTTDCSSFDDSDRYGLDRGYA